MNSASNLIKGSAMSEDPKPVHPSAGEVAEDGVDVVRDTGTDARRTVVPRLRREPSKTENEEDGFKKRAIPFASTDE